MKKTRYIFLVTLLIVSLLLSSSAIAIDFSRFSPMASNYISYYSAYIIATGSGNMTIEFDVTGTGYMDEIGATQIKLYRYAGGSWILLKTYSYTQPQYSYIMGYDDFSYAESVDYAGMSGQQYYATVTVYAAIDGTGDSKNISTSTIYA